MWRQTHERKLLVIGRRGVWLSLTACWGRTLWRWLSEGIVIVRLSSQLKKNEAEDQSKRMPIDRDTVMTRPAQWKQRFRG